MAATWKGSITLGGFPISLSLHERAARRSGRGFKMIDPEHEQPVKQQYVDVEGRPVERSATLRGVERDGAVYPLGPEAVEAIDNLSARSTVLDIASFAPVGSVPLDLALTSYAAVPEGADEPLSVLWNGLRAGKLAAILTGWTARTGSRPGTLALVASVDGLTAYAIPYGHEINATPAWAPKRNRKAADLFGRFIDSAYSVEAFDLDALHDAHEQLREQAITQALAGEPVRTANGGTQPSAAPVIDLMAALSARVEASKAKAQAA